MDHAIDNKGEKLLARDAKGLSTYICCHCFERVNLVKGDKQRPHFRHDKNNNRTPLERSCPEYKENSSYPKVKDKIDKMYIKNGGIPIYLSKVNENKYEIRAYFQILSDNSLEKLKEKKSIIKTNYNSKNNGDIKEWYVDNRKYYYNVDIIKPWIEVECIPKTDIEEVKKKLLWGIRGLNIDKDIYHSNKMGGYRVTLGSNISIGKKYIVMFEKTPPEIKGCQFNEEGYIKLRTEGARIDKNIKIFSFNINDYNEETERFIKSKGYKLVESSNELIPVWPPAVFEGRDLKYDKDDIFFLHINKTKDKVEKIFSTRDYYRKNLQERDFIEQNIIHIKTNSKTISVSNELDNQDLEIKFNIKKVSSLETKEPFKLDLKTIDSENNIVSFLDNDLKPPKDGKLKVQSNLPFFTTISNGGYIIYSSEKYFKNIGTSQELTINSKGFGIIRYKYNNKPIKEEDIFDGDEIYNMLYRCSCPTRKATSLDTDTLYLLGKYVNDKNRHIYRLIELWIKTNRIPISANEALYKIKLYLEGENINGKK